MRYDDPTRPASISADSAPLQVSGSPLPVITLIRPMESEVSRCTLDVGLCLEVGRSPSMECPHCTREALWGWLACIHPHIEGARFGYRAAFLRDLGEFSRDYLDDPERALAKWFKYEGPEARKAPASTQQVDDLWNEG